MIEEDLAGIPVPLGVKKRSSELHCTVSKIQNAIESATFGAEIIAMLTARDVTVKLHIFRESAAAGIRCVAKILTKENKSDAVTKILQHSQ